MIQYQAGSEPLKFKECVKDHLRLDKEWSPSQVTEPDILSIYELEQGEGDSSRWPKFFAKPTTLAVLNAAGWGVSASFI